MILEIKWNRSLNQGNLEAKLNIVHVATFKHEINCNDKMKRKKNISKILNYEFYHEVDHKGDK